MREIPILFSGPMVRALLDGRKTQTRRVVKHQPPEHTRDVFTFHHPDPRTHYWAFDGGSLMDWAQPCPYGEIGDRLWVRESLAPTRDAQGYIADWHYAADGAKVPRMPGLNPDFGDSMAFAHLARPSAVPSIHMPRWASRITLEVAGVRVERLQDISAADAEAEGVDFLRRVPDADETLTPQQLFMCLWDSINEERGFGWSANPWVWIVEFKRIEK
jgi:hypothetical protein